MLTEAENQFDPTFWYHSRSACVCQTTGWLGSSDLERVWLWQNHKICLEEWRRTKKIFVRIVTVTAITKTCTSHMQVGSIISWANLLGQQNYISVLLPKYETADINMWLWVRTDITMSRQAISKTGKLQHNYHVLSG